MAKPMKHYIKILLFNTLLTFTHYIHAQELNYNLVTLNAQVNQKVIRDEMIVQLSVQEQGTQQNQINHIVTNRLNQVLRMAKAHAEFNTVLQTRSTYLINDDENKIKSSNTIWRDVAIIQIKSKNLTALNQFLAKIQEIATINDIRYQVSNELIRANEKVLTEKAIALFRQRANEVTQYLDGKNYKIVQIRLGNSYNNGDYSYYREAKALASTAISETQETAAGETELRLDIDGQIQISY